MPKLSGKIQANFINSRGNFFIADALNRFSRDHFPGGFDEVKSQVLNGVLDVTHGSHADGFACLLEVMKHATLLPLSDSELKPYVGAADKKGICHHLAGDGRLSWVVS